MKLKITTTELLEHVASKVVNGAASRRSFLTRACSLGDWNCCQRDNPDRVDDRSTRERRRGGNDLAACFQYG